MLASLGHHLVINVDSAHEISLLCQSSPYVASKKVTMQHLVHLHWLRKIFKHVWQLLSAGIKLANKNQPPCQLTILADKNHSSVFCLTSGLSALAANWAGNMASLIGFAQKAISGISSLQWKIVCAMYFKVWLSANDFFWFIEVIFHLYWL